MEALSAFVLAGLALAGSPGPANLSLAAIGAAFGVRRGLSYMIGIFAGMIGVMVITASGVVGMLLAVPGATPVVAIAAAVYFAWLAWRIATAPPLSDEIRPRREPSFAGGLFLSLVNPKGYAAMVALFSGFVLIREQVALDAAVKIGVLAAIIAVVNVAWLLAGSTLTRFLREPRTNRIVNITFAVLLIVSVIAALPF
jgi:threonine/homoserine/homoserine lactone efflux protein